MLGYPSTTVASARNALAETLRQGGSVHGYLISQWTEMLVYAMLFLVLLLLAVRMLGLQNRLRTARRDVIAALYGVWLYRRRPLVFLRQELRLVWSNMKLVLWYSPVLLIGAALFSLAYLWIDARHGRLPCPVDSEIVLRLESANEAHAIVIPEAAGNVGDAVQVTARADVPAVRTTWLKLKCVRPGMHALTVAPGRPPVILNVGRSDRPAIPFQGDNDLAVHIAYPRRIWAGLCPEWVAVFLLLACLAAVPLGRVMKVSL